MLGVSMVMAGEWKVFLNQRLSGASSIFHEEANCTHLPQVCPSRSNLLIYSMGKMEKGGKSKRFRSRNINKEMIKYLPPSFPTVISATS